MSLAARTRLRRLTQPFILRRTKAQVLSELPPRTEIVLPEGGKGFTGEGWQTNTAFDLIGDPHAVKGGVFRIAVGDYPTTLRYIGPNTSSWNATLSGLVYESLLGLHPTTLEYIPVLATHWKVDADRMTIRFRIDPNARFNDGTPVTADDVVARMALVPRTLEARGLDATPLIQAKLRKVNTPAAKQAIDVLDVILRDEIGHVAIGNRWFHWLCQRQGLDPVSHDRLLQERHKAPRLKPPFNTGARRQAGFTAREMQQWE